MNTHVKNSRVVVWFVAAAVESLVFSWSVSPTQAAPPAPNQAVDPVFERQVKPILTANCVRCHSGRKIKGGIDLSARDKLLLGGDTGPSVVAGKPADSLLVEVLGAGGKPHMPPKKQLPPAAIAVVSNWIGGLKPGDIPTGTNQQASPNNGGKNKKHGKHENGRHRGRRERGDD